MISAYTVPVPEEGKGHLSTRVDIHTDRVTGSVTHYCYAVMPSIARYQPYYHMYMFLCQTYTPVKGSQVLT
jgi:hypothetical protein